MRGAALYRRTLVWIACAGNLALVSVAQDPRFKVSSQAYEGKKLFAQFCSSCHKVTSRTQLVGPGLKGYYTGHHPEPNDTAVRELITRGKGAMPAFASFTDAEQADLVA